MDGYHLTPGVRDECGADAGPVPMPLYGRGGLSTGSLVAQGNQASDLFAETPPSTSPPL